MSRADTKVGSTYVSFVCQKCRQPLKLDYTFENLSRDTYKELKEPLIAKDTDTLTIPPKQDASNYEEHDDAIHRQIPGIETFEHVDISQEDFTLLGDAQTAPENISHQAKVMGHLFDVLSGQSEVDHPLCQECTDMLLDLQDQQLKLTEDESKDYRDYYDKILAENEGVDEAALDEELKRLKEEEEVLIGKLDSLNMEYKRTRRLRVEAETELREVEKEEEKYYREFNECQRLIMECNSDQQSANYQLEYAEAQLERLKTTNAFNATFHIWHNGQFGTINNFRLGRLPDIQVDWNEINAAWGQAILLLQQLASMVGLQFQRYRLVPYGNHSYIESLTDKSKELPLYASGGFRFFWDTKFDSAMAAFLDCLQQFNEKIQQEETKVNLPYKMENGALYDRGSAFSIRIQFNSEEQWTKALKFMLTNLKWALAWVASRFGERGLPSS